jgi:hypothetical protein
MERPPAFDDWLRQQADSYDPPPYTDDQWAAAEAMLARKKRRRGFFFLWWIGGLMLFGSLLGAGMYSYSGSHLPNTSIAGGEAGVRKPDAKPLYTAIADTGKKGKIAPHLDNDGPDKLDKQALAQRGLNKANQARVNALNPTNPASYRPDKWEAAEMQEVEAQRIGYVLDADAAQHVVPIAPSPNGLPLVARQPGVSTEAALAHLRKALADSAACQSLNITKVDTIQTCADTLILQARAEGPNGRVGYFVVGAVVAAGVYSPVKVAGSDGEWGGGVSLGVRFGYQFTPRFGLRAELAYSMRTGLTREQTSIRIDYSFGQNLSTQSQRLVQLHYLELPIEARITLAKRHQIILGVGLSAVLGGGFVTKSKTDSTSGTSFRLGTPTAVNPVDVYLRAGYGFTFARYFTAFAMAQHGLIPVFPNGRGTSAYNFSLRLGLTYEFAIPRKKSSPRP